MCFCDSVPPLDFCISMHHSSAMQLWCFGPLQDFCKMAVKLVYRFRRYPRHLWDSCTTGERLLLRPSELLLSVHTKRPDNKEHVQLFRAKWRPESTLEASSIFVDYTKEYQLVHRLMRLVHNWFEMELLFHLLFTLINAGFLLKHWLRDQIDFLLRSIAWHHPQNQFPLL